ncbi:MAG: hypothetical protein V3T88_00070 [Nitrosomonadaceae bacterium]
MPKVAARPRTLSVGFAEISRLWNEKSKASDFAATTNPKFVKAAAQKCLARGSNVPIAANPAN